MSGSNMSKFQGFNAPEILAKLDALEKAYKELRKVVLDGVNTSAHKKLATRPSKKFEYKEAHQ